MATIIYDGKSNQTALQTDTVVITADPTLFTQASQNINDVVLRFGANSLTVTGATVTAASLSNITLAGGKFQVGTDATDLSTSPNSLYIGTDIANTFSTGADVAGTTGVSTTTAASKNALFGGTGISAPNDAGDIFTIGGKGSFLVYANGGTDTVRQNATNFDSTSAVTVFGGKGNDTVTLGTANNSGSLLVYGGEDTDTIDVLNAGNTVIYGGTGAGDSADGADFIGLSTSGGKITVFGNGGNDIISGNGANTFAAATATQFANNTDATVYGGTGSDSITLGFNPAVAGAKGTLNVFGGEGGDRIQVVNTGTTTIYGGTGQGDSTDGADSIGLAGSGGTITVFGNAGADIISRDGTAELGTQFAESTNAAVFGGKGNDTINLAFDGAAKGTLAVYGGEDTDTITVANGVGGSTTVFGGTGQGDSADGADTINIGGSGLVNVFGNGGNDTINLGAFTGGIAGTASANVVTVYAGAGNDTINVSGLVNSTETFVLRGNEGNDTYVLGTAGTPEVATATFANVAANASLTVAGLTIAAGAGGAIPAAEIAAAIANKAAGTVLNATVTNGTITGTLNADYNTGSVIGTSGVAFTARVEGNQDNLVLGGTTTGQNLTVVNGTASATAGNGQGVSIEDFTVGADRLSIQNGIVGGGTATITTVPTGGFNDLQAALNAASQGGNGSVSAVVFGGSTYVVTNNGTPGFDVNADNAIKLTGITDLNGVVNSITVL